MPGCVNVSTLSPAEQQNYANWYTYYRRRDFVAKRALSSVISKTTARIGLATLKGTRLNSYTSRPQDIVTPIRNADDLSTPVNPAAVAHKKQVLKSLFNMKPNNGTPLRQALYDVGRYYQGQDPRGWGASPIFGASQGGECQQNFTILMSDGEWGDSGDMSGVVGDADSDGTSAFDGPPYADPVKMSNTDPSKGAITQGTLADIAMHYYETDLSPTLANRVPIIPGVDQNNAQHMVTYTVAFGIAGTLSTTLDPAASGFAWPAPVSGQPTAVDDMWHAAYNGRGQYLSASDPQQLIDALDTMISDIQSRTASNAAVAFNSTSLQTNSQVFRATFNSNRWSGDISAYALQLDPATGKLLVSPNATWDASTDVNQQSPAQRTIVTYDPVRGVGINFDWASLTVPQQTDLRTHPNGTLDTPAAGKARLDYIRGDRRCEINGTGTCLVTEAGTTFNTQSFRTRASALGDVVHSSPTFVGPSTHRYPDNIETKPYSTFAKNNTGRTGMIYVGANDGMLHGLDENGKAVFGYIPSSLFSTVSNRGLHHLSDPGYVHQYYVDLSTTAADAYFNNGSKTDWHTVLTGGLRGGGKGVFALDVTDPAALSTPAGAAGAILWEFNDPDLGYSFSEIRIVKMNNGKWAAVFGNGYNNDPAGDGTAKLFIVYLDGSNLSSPIKLETGVGRVVNADCQDQNSDCNGLSTPSTADLNGDGVVDYIYAGDLHGNLWA